MDEKFAWFLGTLLSDGSIIRPAYRNKGDEKYIAYCIHVKDVEMLMKIKNILNTKANVKEYPNYKSPQCQLRMYDQKEIIDRYSSIKSIIPDDIEGYERHFIRGIVDGDGCLNYRSNRNSLRINIINESFEIVDWCSKIICNTLKLEYKLPKYKEKDHIYIIEWEGRVANLIAWWLYHGSIEECCLRRKHNYYKQYVLKNCDLTGEEELFYAIGATKEDNKILPNINASFTLKWCHIIQVLVKYNTVPIFKNKGKTKYYFLHIPN